MSENLSKLLSERSSLELYARNGFRLLGLCAPADARAVARRFEELRVEVELGRSVGGWAFSPAAVPVPDDLRATARGLQEPAVRLLDEFFWFWPIEYPNTGDDPALVAFMTGDTRAATLSWSEAAGRGEPAGWHNLAVYQHLLALEWLDRPDADRDALKSLWRDADGYWRRVGGDDAVWSRVAARVAALDDPRLPPTSADRMRKALPKLLAGIHSLAAVRVAGRGDAELARFHAKCLERWIGAAPAAALLATEVLPVPKRIAAQIAHARRTAGGMAGARRLWLAVCADLGVLRCLGTPVAALLADQRRALAEAVLELCGAGLAKGDAADAGLLLILLDLTDGGPMAGEAEALFSNAVTRQLEAGTDKAGDENVRIARFITERVLPDLAWLNADPVERAMVHARLAGWLQGLARSAKARSPAWLPWALQVIDTACALPVDPVCRERVWATRRAWAVWPGLVRRPALELSAGGHTLRIDVVGVTLDGLRIEHQELTGVCHSFPGFAREAENSARWSSAERVWELPSELGTDEAVFLAILTALHEFALPRLIVRLREAIQGGVTVPLGPLGLAAGGIFTSDSSEMRPYERLRLATESGKVTLTDDSATGFALTLDPSVDWNVCLLPLLLLNLNSR